MNDILKYLPEFWKWLTSIHQWNTPEGWLARIAVWVVVIYVIIISLKYLLNALFEIQDKWKKLGLPVTFSSEKKVKIRQRQQFCGVLRSDLASIAKAENWNDQFFTDLEAEVEAEGYYFTSALNRLCGRKSYGLRREPSLIKSIDRSAEQSLLLVGAPGSGKSVALRHLAHQLAERAIKSSSEKERIPLYINLKELPSVVEEQLTPDFIKQFVLDNIRRGDADTVDYIRENWDEYRSKGIWFFLFDSFDEIPAVLHAPTGSKVVQLHSEAIRKFLAGMSSCRGVLASREFKGPETLSWQKFRILPLSAQRKEELIDNSFLKSPQKEIVRRHLATNESSIHNNPLFLTLLCRYVKKENAAPVNDHDLLSQHIQWLAYRDPEYTQKRYALSPEQLLQGATTLAVLFAENTSLSLAPTQDEIAAALQGQGNSFANLGDLLAALVDVKIARSDVQEARRGDRRFTFSHRRYQETLFVHYLAEHADFIPLRELLTNLRWREYAVTLLQTQPTEKTAIILNEAARILSEYSQTQKPVPILPEFGGHLSYYEWDANAEVALLRLLQEGLSRRIKEVPADLSQQIALLLEPRWNDGDEYDREMVIETGGLLPQQTLIEYLTYAIEHGSKSMRDAAFKKMNFLSDIQEKLADWLRDRLSMEVLSAKNQADILKLEVLSSSFPDSVGSYFVFSRSLSIREMNIIDRISNLIGRMFANSTTIDFVEKFFDKLIKSLSFTGKSLKDKESINDILIMLLYLIALLVYGSFISLNTWINYFDGNLSAGVISISFVVLSCYLSFRLLLLLTLRKIGKRMPFSEILYIQIPLDKVEWLRMIGYITVSVLLVLLAVLPGFILNIIFNFKSKRDILFYAYIFDGCVFICSFLVFTSYKRCSYKNRLNKLRLQNDNIFPIIFYFRSIDELTFWLLKELNNFLPNREYIRSLLRLLRSQPEEENQCPVFRNPLFQKKWEKESVDRLAKLLLRRLRK